MTYYVTYIGMKDLDQIFGAELSRCTLQFETKQEALRKARNLRRQVYKGRRRYYTVEVTNK